MDAKTLESIGAKVTSVRVEYNRKIGDGDFGSIGASMAAEVNILEGSDPDAISKALYDYCRGVVADGMKPAVEAVEKRKQPAAIPQPPDEEPEAIPVGLPEPVRVPVDDAGGECETFDVTHFNVHEQDGRRSAKVFGGKYTKYGVTCWPEVMEGIGVNIKAVNLGTDYKLPGGLKKAVVQLNEKGKPQKVIRFE
jgi:hypothetical protein